MTSHHHSSNTLYASKDEETLPALAPASVSSNASSSEFQAELDKSLPAQPLPKVIEARRQKQVSFGEISFRSYPVILGDHPDCMGAPLSFDWDFCREESYDLEDYEVSRAPRRDEKELVMDWMLRKRILRCYAGVSEDEINERTTECATIRRHRENTKKIVSLASSVRHLLFKASGGLLKGKRGKQLPSRPTLGSQTCRC